MQAALLGPPRHTAALEALGPRPPPKTNDLTETRKGNESQHQTSSRIVVCGPVCVAFFLCSRPGGVSLRRPPGLSPPSFPLIVCPSPPPQENDQATLFYRNRPPAAHSRAGAWARPHEKRKQKKSTAPHSHHLRLGTTRGQRRARGEADAPTKRRRRPPQPRPAAGPRTKPPREAPYFFFLPSSFFLSTDLTTPTATVWRMSRTAKRPRGGYSTKDSTTRGLEGSSVT